MESQTKRLAAWQGFAVFVLGVLVFNATNLAQPAKEPARPRHSVDEKGLFIAAGPSQRITGNAAAVTGFPRITADNVESAARRFIDDHSKDLKVTSSRFKRLGARQTGGRWHVTFSQQHNGIDVYGAKIILSLMKDNKAQALQSNVFPNVSCETTPALDGQTALDIANRDTAANRGKKRISQPGLIVVPIRRGDEFDYRLCWQFTVHQPDTHKKWQYFIDAQTGKIVAKWDALVHGTISGRVQLEYKPEFAADATATAGAGYETVSAQLPDVVIRTWNFSTNPSWSLSGLWAYGVPTGAGSNGPDPALGYTGTSVIGYNLAGDYPDGMTTTEYATTPAVNCQNYRNVRLKFYRWLGAENSSFDQACIEVSRNGSTWTRVWSNPDTAIADGAWIPQTIDISAVADNQSAVYVRWGMGPTDSANTYCGWNLDDVSLVQMVGNTTSTTSDGTFFVMSPGDPCTIVSQLRGNFCSVTYAGGGADSIFTQSGVTSANTVNWTWNAGLYHGIDEPNAYYHVQRAHDFFKTLDLGFTGLDYPMPVTVHVANLNDSYWDGQGLTFGAGDEVTFGNYALYSEVIYHEYAHGVTDKIYGSPAPAWTMEAGAMNEGWSDYFGCRLSPSQSPQVLDGGLVIDSPTGLRTLTNDYRRELDFINDAHTDSQMFSGALWQIREALGDNIADPLVHFARYAQPATFDDCVMALLDEDDARYGDGNLANGVPHGQAIYSAFADHGLGGLQYLVPSVVIGDPAGNNNGRLDPGETDNLSLTLTNGWADATNITATLSATDPYVTIVKSTANFPPAAHGSLVNNSADPWIVTLAGNCPPTHTVTFTLRITASGPYPYPRTCLFTCAVAVGQLSQDDGGADNYLGSAGVGISMAAKLTPDKYPCFLSGVRLFPSEAGTVTVRLWKDDGPGGTPGTQLASLPMTIPVAEHWFDLDIASLNLRINAGSVYVGFVTDQNGYFNGFDCDPPYYHRSWTDTGQGWTSLEDYGWLGNLMVRATFSDQPPVSTAPPNIPHGPDPADNATGVPVNYKLSWNNFTAYLENFSNGLAQGWVEDVDANWNVVNGDYVAYLASPAASKAMVSLYNARSFDNLAFETQIRRQATSDLAQYLLVRVSSDFRQTPTPAGSGYLFGFYGQQYSVWKSINGVMTNLHPWTTSAPLLAADQWNTVRAVAAGSNLTLDINGTEVWTGTDSSITAGRIGLMGWTNSGNYTTRHFFDNISVTNPLAAQLPPDNVTYTVYLGKTANTLAQIYDGPNLSFQPATLDYRTGYFWKVAARNPYGSATGPVWQFTTGSDITGTIDLRNYTGDKTAVAVTIDIFNPGGSTPLETHTVHMNSTGHYTFTTPLTGPHDLSAKAARWLRKRQNAITIGPTATTVNFILTNGDADSDNAVTSSDVAIILAGLGGPAGDLDGDNTTTSADLTIILTNLDTTGD